jgi:hypothetical protein
VSPGPYYQDDFCTIFHCDIRECPELPDIACVVTSPPYNVGIDYGNDVDDVMPWDLYRELAEATCRVSAKALVSGGRASVNVAPAVSTREGTGRISLLVFGRTLYSRPDLISGITCHGPPRGGGRVPHGARGRAQRVRTCAASGN